jgi:hypothetical protein
MRFLITFLFLLSSSVLMASTQGQGTLSFTGAEAIKKQVDLVFILDNSGSMTFYKKHVISEIAKTLKHLEINMDYKVAFIDSDFRSQDFIGLDEELTDSQGIEERLEKFMHLNAHFEERPLDTTLALLKNYSHFKRVNSDLVIINLTNEDDQSLISTQDYLSGLLHLYQTPIHHILVSDKEATNCQQRPVAQIIRLRSLLVDEKQQHFSLCENFSSNLNKAFTHKVRLDLGIKLPMNHQVKLMIDGHAITDYVLSTDRSVLFFQTQAKLRMDSEILLKFNI